jgi:hypothetical protein
MVGFIDTIYTQLGTTDNYSAIADLHTLQFTAAKHIWVLNLHSPLVVSWQRIYQSRCNFKSHVKSFLYNLIPVLPLFCNYQLNSIPLLRSSYPGRLASRNSTQFFATELFFITPLHGPRGNRSLSIVGKACLQRRCIAIVACVFVAAGMCLPSRCLAMNVYSDFTIPAFGRHVTIFINHHIIDAT